MSAHLLLLDNLPHLASLKGGVTRFRDLVLDLAVRGALVSQAPNKNAVRTDFADDNISPYEIPDSWAWARGSDIFSFVTSGSRGWARHYSSDGPIFVRIGNLDYRTISIDISDVQHVSPPSNAEGVRTRVQSGDILISITGDTGMVGLVPAGFGEAYINQHIALARPRAGLYPPYIAWALAAPSTLGRVQQAQRGIKNSLGLDDIRNIAIPLPPIDEQQRIVAKVDQLMALCDELEAKQAKKRELGDRLTKAAFEALSSFEDTEFLQATWAKIAPELAVLSDIPSAIRELRAAVLRLAIRGQLTQRDRRDDHPSEVLKDISEKRARLAAAKMASKPDILPAVDEPDFAIPESWAWVRFGEATICRDCQRIPLSKEERAGRKGRYDYYGASGIIDSIDDFIFAEPLLLVGEDGANLVNRSTPIAFIASGKYWVNNHAHVLDSATEDVLRYLALYINAIDLKPYVTGTAQPKMNQAKMNMIPVALPPRGEQLRIVAKVDQLMKLCDDLEARLRARDEKAARLAEALVAQILA